ncbi:MAG: endonuclease/exonuclease/phosphatase [Gemmatimonadetes bacterium]|nr:endonuclease/exonuclease/phosphatase [Gemmatimonadota bacterium]
MRKSAALIVAFVLLAGCRTGRNYTSPDGPRYAGAPPAAEGRSARGDTLRIASFNIEYALHVDSAIAVLTSDTALRRADVLLLQEMDEPGTRKLAAALGMGYVYYPATLRAKSGRDFGNAVLARWPIAEDAKIRLPHAGIVGRTQRIATAATVRVGEVPVRIYSAHLGTMVNATPAARRGQMRAILADAERFPRVIIGGDMNSHGVGNAPRAQGYAWLTENGPRTTKFGRWDHIFTKGLPSAGPGASGTVLDVRGASDHRPVWADVVVR